MDARTNDGETADREIATTRLIDAPRELVFDAWTDPQQIGAWWGPKGFTTTTHKMEVKPGGVWRFVMHGPDGRDYRNKITYLEIVRPERLVYAHGGDDNVEPVSFQTTVTFTDRGGKTELTLRAVFPTSAERDRVAREYGAVEGGRQTLERLDQHVTRLAGDGQGDMQRDFVVWRIFDAPRALVWQAWTEPERLAQWWGPKGCKIRVVKLDLRPGGMFHYAMQFKPGQEMWGRFVYGEIAAPERLAFVNSFSDAQGGITRAPFSESFPLEIANTLTLAEENGKTTLTLRGHPVNASEAEYKTFLGMFGSMRQGFGGTFDQLADYLARS
jgi:uncharacterized protein YndB with AHSA1/START domain